jgi:hypothetical protein
MAPALTITDADIDDAAEAWSKSVHTVMNGTSA